MAKARDIDGLRASMPFAEAAAATVAVRAEELFEHSAGVLDMTDIERVHDMRVASRRLRAVLEIYAPCFPKAQFKPLLREVKDLADALGERRDPDVLLDRLATLEAALPKANAPGIEAFAAPVREEQQRGNETLAAALERAERTNLKGRLALLAASAVEPSDEEVPAGAEAAVAGLAPPPRGGRRPPPWRRSPPTTARASARPETGPPGHEGAQGQGPRAAGDARRQRRAHRARAARRAAVVHPQGPRPRRGHRAARHADRGQAPALRPRGHGRVVLRPVRRDGAQAHEGAAGPARRDPRLRRPAAAGPRAHGGAAGRRRPHRPPARGPPSAGGSGGPPTPAPPACAPRRTPPTSTRASRPAWRARAPGA